MNTEEFYKFPKELARATGYVCQKTGEMVKFTPSTKIVYAYMISRNEFFTEKLKRRHFESQRVIAESCGMDEKSCGKILRKMLEHGLLEGERKQPEQGGHPRYYYKTVNTDVQLWKRGEGAARPTALDEDKERFPPLSCYEEFVY